MAYGHRRRRWPSVGWVALLCLHLAACGAPSSPLIIDQSSPLSTARHPATIIVASGDSLYRIAWRFGLDFLDIAKWNGITKPYLIRAGQRLRLRPSAAAADSRADSAAESTAKQSAAAKAAPDADAPAHWRWPAGGQLIGRFSRRQGHNGIKIAGRAGSLVRAAAAGEVMYVGAALLGYGNLIIIKHSATYLSAYAHNQKILVAEGERIRINQPIARMGSSGAERTMLHFEIRKNGKPVDPLEFLD